ncbi:crossover junction endodeoxyribonuclease RuvC [bacterium 336/3]|nr:crossover junction endodeoxyribonuclease RuvC [bacterium 336/3]
MKNIETEKIILGIDPGTRIMGYAVIKVLGKNIEVLQYGVINLEKYTNQEIKLKKIFERVTQIVDEFLPDEVALEAPFYGKNVQSMLKLGRAQGVAMTAALMREIPITEYAPRKVKQSVTGTGTASKEDLAVMLEKILKIKFADNTLLDASDALGVALCHHYQGGVKTNKAKGWGDFLKENPDKVKKKIKKKTE